MAFKRKFFGTRSGRGSIRKPFIKRNSRKKGSALRKLASRVNKLSKTIEVKSGVTNITDNISLRHNNLVIISSDLLETQTGMNDSESSRGQRIGDKVTLQRLEFRMMFELNESFTDVSLRLMVVRSAKADTPDITTLFHGASGNKMLDTFNNERYGLLYQKWIKIKTTSVSVIADGTQFPGSGLYAGTRHVISRATKIVKFSVPGTAFTKNGIIQYENLSFQPKFFDYHFIVFAYSNYATVDSGPIIYAPAFLNDCIMKMHYKDA